MVLNTGAEPEGSRVQSVRLEHSGKQRGACAIFWHPSQKCSLCSKMLSSRAFSARRLRIRKADVVHPDPPPPHSPPKSSTEVHLKLWADNKWLGMFWAPRTIVLLYFWEQIMKSAAIRPWREDLSLNMNRLIYLTVETVSQIWRSLSDIPSAVKEQKTKNTKWFLQ